MAINIGINGFGRIGRLVFRSAINNDDFNVVCVNDLLEINHLAYLLKYDSVHGPFEGSVEVSEDKLIVNGVAVLKNFRGQTVVDSGSQGFQYLLD